ncbi:putative quinol monooxygenase [Hyalangium versicolor]|uniref:putative quinol monooxygenase n=1 Tax=Hyalangium versicolor TaxID=2861190 RepID=UPI001CCB3750|nr:putative quinol monooxygenase [Hyalangium versicolor]
MSDIIYVVAKLQAQTGKESALKGLLEPLTEPTRREKGCLRYIMLEDRQNPSVIILLEEWENEADLNAHLGLPHLQKLFGQLPAVLAAPPEVIRYKKIA